MLDLLPSSPVFWEITILIFLLGDSDTTILFDLLIYVCCYSLSLSTTLHYRTPRGSQWELSHYFLAKFFASRAPIGVLDGVQKIPLFARIGGSAALRLYPAGSGHTDFAGGQFFEFDWHLVAGFPLFLAFAGFSFCHKVS